MLLPVKSRIVIMKHSRMLLLLLSLALVLLTSNCVGQLDWECIPSCKCIWVSGKKTAECKEQNLTNIPNALSKEIQHLDLSGNYINSLSDKVFTKVKLDNLQKLVLYNCNISTVHAEAFNGLRIVIEIDLSNNHIRHLQRGTFDETERLRVLVLNQNELQRLDDDLFHDLIFLQKIELSDNQLLQIGQKAFWNLPGLQTLTLDGNNLTNLDMKSFENLPKLGSLELQKNPWNCDCYLKPFRDWTIQRKLYTKPTSCEYPLSLLHQMWDEISDDEFACIPIIYNIGIMPLSNYDSSNAHLWCRASAKPKPQITWVHRQWVLSNSTKRHNGNKNYIVLETDDWSNLTIPGVVLSDKGEYICRVKNFGGIVEKNVSLIIGESNTEKDNVIGLPLAIGLGLVAFLFLLVTLTLCVCYCRRRRNQSDPKSIEATSLDHHGLGEQKSLITAINPVVKPPRRCEAPSVTSHGTEMTELNRTLLDNDSVFTDGVGSVMGVLANGLNDEERGCVTPELDSMLSGPGLTGVGVTHGGNNIGGIGSLLRCATSYRQYPPDLLAFSAGCNSSPTSQTSTAPDSSRLPNQTGLFNSPASPSTYASVGFKTLPHPTRASSATPYSLGHLHSSMPRHGYITIPRRPRAPSWSSGPPISSTEREILEPVYDNLGRRTTADGSSVPSLNKSPEPGLSMRGRPLPSTPNTPSSSSPHNALSLPRPPRNLQLNRSAPEGAAEWTTNHIDEQQQQQRRQSQSDNESEHSQTSTIMTKTLDNCPNANALSRKVPPRPPPKPKKKNSTNGPLYEDEGEDGTEV
ncbi:PREDICTED: uncharacterized protein LOC105363411 isoform X2 [Ceratosolen solmsi marchali]|uniref:Uncharacterized protein LOC105363411 isoform X2 n=1 Tax=Ceratosolen solmsi marchali TaxID=326594 RepID=A0AAJ7DWW7_9HYME|nr:PREDICTED: uncharacterized protein LOC105363411 isoform X2 [Ceratosolen solmsi marchali]